MKFEQGAGAVRPFDRNFWTIHLLLPLAVAILVLSSLERTGVDLWLADRWYAFEGYRWALRNHWLVSQVIHRDGKGIARRPRIVPGNLAGRELSLVELA